MNVYLYIERHIYFDGVQSIYIKYIYIYIESDKDREIHINNYIDSFKYFQS